jgi:hypothetical protein
VRFDASIPMASEVGAGTFWQGIVDDVTGRPLTTVLDQPGRLADPHADTFDSARRHRDPGVAPVTAGVARTAAVVGTRAAGVTPGAVERWVVMSNSRNAGAAAGGGAIYGLGIFGALVYFWQQADRFWEYLLAVVQGLFWPAFMVYEVFKALGRSG